MEDKPIPCICKLIMHTEEKSHWYAKVFNSPRWVQGTEVSPRNSKLKCPITIFAEERVKCYGPSLEYSDQKCAKLYTRIHASWRAGIRMVSLWRTFKVSYLGDGMKHKEYAKNTRKRDIEAKSPSWRSAPWPPNSSSSIFSTRA